ncbi:TetR/AcrR family transcriptional regulator [Amycolatopsis sp. DSM 110486]|uniref:TetR/AcrR family transcriptional regulator n=1 Tax=Amycolatopsis sp. DSM 110486 TaxID=2865832 RepID=UPI0021084445|nr:TetR/AcrR family transcriptional regulator [Amycolatopsis sp. DSM 110486]
MFAERGLSVPLREVADAAGVGIATLYRRFPTREDLITGVFTEKMTIYAESVETALADPDPWHGFCGYLETLCAMQAEDQGFTHVLTLSFPTAKAFEAQRRRAYQNFARLIGKAQESGRLRPDFVAEDLIMLLMANAGVLAATAQTAPNTWRRFLAYMIESFDTAATTDELPAPPSARAMFRAMRQAR